MKKGYFYFSDKKKSNIKNQEGLTLVEVVIALLVISIITLVLVRGTILSADAIKINREKTRAQAIASEKLDIIRAMNYEDIEYTDQAGNPVWGLDNPALIEDGYDISYEVTRVYVGDSSYKQVKVNIFKEPMKVPLSVITQIYPMGEQEGIPGYLPPENLSIESDGIVGGTREIKLVWEAPDTELEINNYKIYRDGELIGSASTELFINNPGNNNTVYSFYVTVLYADGIESIPGNTVTTETYSPPQNLHITGYSGSGNNRTVNLAWDAPDTQLVVNQYIIYRNNIEVGRTANRIFSNIIGNSDYTFNIKAVYAGGIISDPSNGVTTITYSPPRNLHITGYSGSGNNRTVNLAWDAPDTQQVIIQYVVYRNAIEIGRTADTNYQNIIGSSNYNFHITAIYEDGTESSPSNTVTTGTYSPPRNLRITGYSGIGNNRRVNLAWDAPDTQLIVVEYAVYRAGVEVGRTTNRSFSNRIGRNNYTFYVKAVYQGGILSDPSNEVTTR
ncbi:MAG: prepilin-type N-terminal cleavage/methylation domain-containing protein [Actinomycetota bacterium]|nr:prepilin-type N-terminal cleavage/methylation domain-containing protein [Actinomycetota bacterium]